MYYVFVAVQFYPCFNLSFSLFYTHFHVTTHNIEPRIKLNHKLYLYHAQNKAPLFVVLYWVEIITEFIFKSKHLEEPWQYALVCHNLVLRVSHLPAPWSERKTSILSGLSCFLKVFPYCARWSHMDDMPYWWNIDSHPHGNSSKDNPRFGLRRSFIDVFCFNSAMIQWALEQLHSIFARHKRFGCVKTISYFTSLRRV